MVRVVRNDNGIELTVSGSGSSRTFIMPACAVTVSVSFKETPYTITKSTPSHGSFSVPTSGTLGQTITISSITPDADYSIDMVRVVRNDNGQELTVSGTGSSRTFTMPASAVTVSVSFSAIPYTITKSTPSHGSFSVPTSGTLGQTITISSITPDTDYSIDMVRVVRNDNGIELTVSGSGSSRTFIMPACAVTVSVSFKETPYTITKSTPSHGSFSVPASGTLGQTITISSITPDADYSIDMVRVVRNDNGMELTVSGSGSSRTFIMPACGVTVSVTFAEIEISNITVSPTTLTLYVDDPSYTLDWAITPSDALGTVTFSSSNPAVATVTSGLTPAEGTNGTITAKSPGTAIITASIGGKTATCTVTVIEITPPLITADEGHPKGLEVTISSSDPGTTVYYSVQDYYNGIDYCNYTDPPFNDNMYDYSGPFIVNYFDQPADITDWIDAFPLGYLSDVFGDDLGPVYRVKACAVKTINGVEHKSRIVESKVRYYGDFNPVVYKDFGYWDEDADSWTRITSKIPEECFYNQGTFSGATIGGGGNEYYYIQTFYAKCGVSYNGFPSMISRYIVYNIDPDSTSTNISDIVTVKGKNGLSIKNDSTVTQSGDKTELLLKFDWDGIMYWYDNSTYLTVEAIEGQPELRSVSIEIGNATPTSVAFTETPSEPLDIGETFQLDWTILPATATGTVTFTSSNPAVATVTSGLGGGTGNNGVITAKTPGTATITITTRNGLTDTCTVTVDGTYTITYDANGGNGSPASQTKTYDVPLTLSSTVPARKGYTFLGWSTNQEATTATYSAGGSYTLNADNTLYAVWEAKEPTDITVSPTSLSLEVGDTYTLDWAITPSDALGTVTFTSSNPSKATVTSGLTPAEGTNGMITAKAPGTATITASIGGITATCTVSVTENYTITYDANGGSGAPASQTKIYGAPLTLRSTEPTRTGYTFLGWSTSQAATSATYLAGGSYTSNADAVLYAVWKADTYTISYNANGGTGAPASQTKTYGVTLTLSSTTPTRTGYTFLGWATSSTATAVAYSAGGSYTSNASATLYAVYKVTDNPTVTYQSHVQEIGWQGWVSNGAESGTTGQSLRLEAIRIGVSGIDGGVQYKSHVQDIGWMDWVSDNSLSGTSGQSLRLEAIQIMLTGKAAEQYDIYYSVHAENFGWLGWAKNGAASGTAGFSYRLEAIRIVMIPKGQAAPGSTANAFVQNG